MSFCELVGGMRLTPVSCAYCGMYFAYEFQKSVSARGRSTAMGAPLPSDGVDPEESQPVAVTAREATSAAVNTARLVRSMGILTVGTDVVGSRGRALVRAGPGRTAG